MKIRTTHFRRDVKNNIIIGYFRFTFHLPRYSSNEYINRDTRRKK